MCPRLLSFQHTVDINTWGRCTPFVPSLKYGVSFTLPPLAGMFSLKTLDLRWWIMGSCTIPLKKQVPGPGSFKHTNGRTNGALVTSIGVGCQFVGLKFSSLVARAVSALSQRMGLGIPAALLGPGCKPRSQRSPRPGLDLSHPLSAQAPLCPPTLLRSPFPPHLCPDSECCSFTFVSRKHLWSVDCIRYVTRNR